MNPLIFWLLVALAWALILVIILAVLRSGQRQDERMAALGVRKAIEREEGQP